MRHRRRFPTVVLLLLLALLSACGASDDEVARVRAPDGRLDAVVVEQNGGATTTFYYTVHLTAPDAPHMRGRRAAFLEGATRSDRAWGVTLRWRTPTELHVAYHQARRTSAQSSRTRIAGRAVQVVLDSGVVDSAAPPGGMLRNRAPR